MVCTAPWGCSGWAERQAVRTSVRIMKRTQAAVAQEPDLELARAGAAAGLKTLEGFHLADPGNQELLDLVAGAYCQYAVGFLHDDWEAARLAGPEQDVDVGAGMDHGHRAARQAAAAHLAHVLALRDRALGLLGRCVNYGLMMLGAPWPDAVLGDDPEAAIGLAARSDAVEGMFWVALGLGTMVGLDPGNPRLAARLPLVIALLERVIALDDRHLDGLPHMTLGIVLSARSAAVGGDPARGKAHFEKARAITAGKSLLVDVMMARIYAVTTRDETMFRDTLQRVLRTPPSIWPENRLSNEMAHRKARRYLEHANRFF